MALNKTLARATATSLALTLNLSLALGLAPGAARAQTPAQSAAAHTAPPSAEVFVQTGNTLMATVARFSPDGTRLATCDGSGTVIGWDASSGRQYRELHKHNGTCLGLAFMPDGERVVSSGGAASGNEVVVSRWVDGTELQRWEGVRGQVLDVVGTADGQGAWALAERGGLLRWNVGSAQPAQTVPALLAGEAAAQAPFSSVMAMARDGSRAYVGRRDGSILAIGLRPGDAPPTLLARLPENVSALALSPDGRLLAASRGTMQGSAGKEIVLLDTSSGQEVRRLTGHAGNVFALAFSPDGSLLASAAQIDLQTMLQGPFSAIRDHEALRLWRVADGALLADERNRRNANGVPFLRGSVAFSQSAAAGGGPARLALAMWDEAARVYDVLADATAVASVGTSTGTSTNANGGGLRLLHTLEGRGLSPRQLKASDASAQLLVSDGRPRKAPPSAYLQAAQVRAEFGTAADWTPERARRIDTFYTGRGMLTKVQKASLWDLKTGRLQQVVDWQRGAVSEVGLDAQGRFTSVARMFPDTILVSPLRTRVVREATLDAQGQTSLRHFGYEPWDGPPDQLFVAMNAPAAASASAAPSAPTAAAVPGAPATPPHAGSYGTDVITQSPSQRWTAIAGVPIQNKKDEATSGLSPRVFVQERLADGRQIDRHDIALPGIVRAMAISADDRTLWVSGTAKGLPYDMAHEAWLAAIDLAEGRIVRRWALAEGITVDKIAAHPGGELAITNGGTNLSIWDRGADARKYFVKASEDLRPVRALGMSADGHTIAAADTTGWTVLWDWPEGREPVRRWARELAAPAPHLLDFLAANNRLAAGADDGSVRLLDNRDGSEIARMIRFDDDEWITIIPEGYFVASQDGDRWVNVRMDGKVYGIDQFYDVFYRPDIVERRLAGQPIAPLITVTLEDAIRRPPPRVTLAPPRDGASAGQKVRVRVQALTQGGGVGEVRIMHNGKLVEVLNRAVVTSGLAGRRATGGAGGAGGASGAAGSQPASPAATTSAAAANAPGMSAQVQSAAQGEQAVTRALRLAVQSQQDAANAKPPVDRVEGEVEIELVAGENAISAIGFNGPGNLNARPVTRTLNAAGTAPPPRIFVLAVGVNQFADPNMAPPLSYAVKDSTDFARAVAAKLGTAYKDAPVELRLLQNDKATRAGLVQALDQLQKEVRTGDLLVWFVASHGTLDNDAQYGIVLQDWDGRASAASLFSTTDILDASRRIKAFNQFVVLDTCHAGGLSSIVRGLYDARLAVLARNMGLHVFASASATEEAIDGYQGNGLFTHTLLKGLNTGAADRNADKVVTINELGDYARRETMRIARALRHSQEPLLMNFGKDVKVYELQ